jgi:hypothetical protein
VRTALDSTCVIPQGKSSCISSLISSSCHYFPAADIPVSEIPVSAHVLGELMPYGILNRKLWRDHTFHAYEALQTALYIPGFYKEHPRVSVRWFPEHSRTALLFYMVEKDREATDVLIHAILSLQKKGLWILNPVITHDGRLVGPDLDLPKDTLQSQLRAMMAPINPIAQFSARLTSPSTRLQYLMRVNKRIATTFCRRLVVSEDMLSGPYFLAGRTYGSFRCKPAYDWEWVAFRFSIPLLRTKPLVYINGSADHFVLRWLDIPQAFWDLGILVFMTIHTAAYNPFNNTSQTFNLNPLYEVVYDILTQFPEVVPIWVVSWRGVHMQLLDITRINATNFKVTILEGIEGIILGDEIRRTVSYPWAVAEIRVYGLDNSASFEISTPEHFQFIPYRWGFGCNVVVRVLRLVERNAVVRWAMAWRPLLPTRLQAIQASTNIIA